MAMNISFVGVADSIQSLARSAGAFQTSSDVPICPFALGDVVADPAAPGVFFEVVGRLFGMATSEQPAQWQVFIAPTADPYDRLAEKHKR
jgi:hypothetical protein